MSPQYPPTSMRWCWYRSDGLQLPWWLRRMRNKKIPSIPRVGANHLWSTDRSWTSARSTSSSPEPMVLWMNNDRLSTISPRISPALKNYPPAAWQWQPLPQSQSIHLDRTIWLPSFSPILNYNYLITILKTVQKHLQNSYLNQAKADVLLLCIGYNIHHWVECCNNKLISKRILLGLSIASKLSCKTTAPAPASPPSSTP